MPDSLATADRITATQTPGLVTIEAGGNKPTPGHEVLFQESPMDIFPPQYRLILIEPAQPSADVITPFQAHTSFAAQDVIKTVVVSDAQGRHKVPVDQAQD